VSILPSESVLLISPLCGRSYSAHMAAVLAGADLDIALSVEVLEIIHAF
jgi:hypothetical protein